ncbi:Homeobox protein CUP9 [Escovopsis weberi]|uniref:Homeobox protein CUP9 n=1 Tax=Escovopsis weberi TaxID=150374 RepID=A0A0M9VRY7_ESCWE|nr:Homeobox protein CUP9 [Escovopsis weberi]
MGLDMSSMGQAQPVLSRRNSSDSVKRIRVLRNWFAGHWKHPYPDEQEKAALVEQSGLTKTQVVNWFANARRRQRAMAQSHTDAGSRVFAQGSPMPESSLAGMSPMERWRNSPPSEEHISATELEGMMDVSGFCSSETTPNGFSDRGNMSDGAHSSVSGESSFYHPAAAPVEWPASASSAMSMYPPEDAGRHDLGHVGPGPGQLGIPAPIQRDDRIFRCTFCHQSFKKKYDWVRHERSIHLPGLDTWICAMPLTEAQSSLVWQVGNDHPECIFCGEASPTEEHIESHEFQACAERPLSERTFTRKDHLWQHLHKFHQCRKWEGWRPNLQLLQRARDEVESECGFCKFRMRTWSERADHLGRHFRNGANMADWVGGPGIKDVKYEGLLGWD